MRWVAHFVLFCVLCTTGYAEGNLGHRLGGDVYQPENTLYCYKKALGKLQHKAEFLYVEFDIQETKDGHIVVFHDTDSIERLVPNSPRNRGVLRTLLRNRAFEELRIRDLTLAQVERLTLSNRARIPSLKDVLDASVKWRLRKPMLIEIKSLRTDQCRLALIETVTKYQERLDVHFLAFPDRFALSFPDPLRWNSTFHEKGFKVYQAKKDKIDAHDLVGIPADGAETWDFQTVLDESPFAIRENESRTLTYPVVLAPATEKSRAVRVGVYHGYDDSGDKGLRFRLLGEDGKVLLQGLAKSKGWRWFESTLDESQQLELVLEDLDTDLTGKYPGNGGAVKLTVVTR